MTLHTKVGSAWTPVKDLWVKRAGTWTPVRKAFVNQAGVWRQYFQDEVIAYYGSRSDIPAATWAFSDADLDNALLVKRLQIVPGAEIGAHSGSHHAMHTQHRGWRGGLIIDNYGTISGRGGQPNAGEGGYAFFANGLGWEGQKPTLNNYGTLRGGGGAGGRGGDGGGGFYDQARTVQEGPLYGDINQSYGYVVRRLSSGTRFAFYWGGFLGNSDGAGGREYAELNSGGWTYRTGNWRVSSSGIGYYEIIRSYVTYDRYYTGGGAGGNGGRGQGYDGMNAGGNGGGAPGANAGWGGTGGWGMHYGGGAGLAGQPGGNGNNGGGGAGQAGGQAGFYLHQSANINFNNYGTVQGRIS